MVFLVLIFLPALMAGAGIGQIDPLVENKKLAPFPHLSLKKSDMETFPEELTAYFNDRFPFRGSLIRLDSLVKLNIFHIDIFPGVVVGRDGWLFLRGFDKFPAITNEGLPGWEKKLSQRQNWTQTHSMHYLFVSIPTKPIIYPEEAPGWAGVDDPRGREDSSLITLSRQSGATVLDLEPALYRSKSEGRLYHKTDTHWNNAGSYIGYREIMNVLHRWFPRLKAHAPEDFETRINPAPGMDLARMIGLQKDFREDRIELSPKFKPRARVTIFTRPSDGIYAAQDETLIVTEVDDPALPTAVVFRDSYFRGLLPFMAEHFRRMVCVWSYSFDPTLLEREKPDVVITEMSGSLPDDPDSLAGDQTKDYFQDRKPGPLPIDILRGRT